jgi:hypothetical protein
MQKCCNVCTVEVSVTVSSDSERCRLTESYCRCLTTADHTFCLSPLRYASRSKITTRIADWPLPTDVPSHQPSKAIVPILSALGTYIYALSRYDAEDASQSQPEPAHPHSTSLAATTTVLHITATGPALQSMTLIGAILQPS